MTTAPAFALNLNFLDVLAAAGVRILSRGSQGPSGIALRVVHRKRIGSIIVTQADWDGVEWIHASMSYSEMPTYEDLSLLHRAVFGRRRYAYQVFAPESSHVNLHDTALHLWGRADGRPATPEFGELGTI